MQQMQFVIPFSYHILIRMYMRHYAHDQKVDTHFYMLLPMYISLQLDNQILRAGR